MIHLMKHGHGSWIMVHIAHCRAGPVDRPANLRVLSSRERCATPTANQLISTILN